MSGFWRRIREKLLPTTAEPSATDHDEPGGEIAKGELSAKPRLSALKPARYFVGLDFGTSGTKVVLRDSLRPADPPVAIDFGTPSKLGFSRFSFPSTVAICHGKVLFGSEAELANCLGLIRVRSMKRSLLGIESRVPETSPQDPGVSRRLWDGVPGSSLEEKIESLAIAYLAEVIRRSHEVLRDVFEDPAPGEVSIHIDLPVEKFDAQVKDSTEYLEYLQRARYVASRLETHPRPERLFTLIEESRAAAVRRVQSDSQAREEVVAEAVAAVAGLGESLRQVTGKNFAVVDIGGGTTDIGIFRFPTTTKGRAAFYATNMCAKGCDDVDRALCGELGLSDQSTKLLYQVRQAKSDNLGGGDVSNPLPDGIRIGTTHLERAVNSVQPELFRAWEKVARKAYSKDMQPPEWCELELYTIGGGALVPPLRETFEEPPTEFVEHVHPNFVRQGFSVRSAGASRVAPNPERDLGFLLTALGLSLPKFDRPELVPPQKIEGFRPESGVGGDYDVDADDLYAK